MTMPDLREPEPLDEPVLEPEPEQEPEPDPESVSGDVIDAEPVTEQAIARQATDLVGRAKTLIVRDPASFEQAGRFLETLKTKLRQIEDFFEADVNRAHATWKGLTTKRAGYADPLKEAIAIISSRYATFAREEKQRAEAERRLREQAALESERARLKAEADAREAEAVALAREAELATTREEGLALEAQADEATVAAAEIRQEAATVQAPVLPLQSMIEIPKGTSVRANWKHEVEDKMALIRAVVAGNISHEAVIPNDVYLGQRARADKATAKIPGVRVYDAGSVAVKRAK